MPVTEATRPLEDTEDTADFCPPSGPELLFGADLEPGAVVAGRFTILGRLGHGSMGAVYRARQEAVGREVALKIVRRERSFDAETRARFEREARAISLLTSQHTVTAFDFGEANDGSWYLAMEMLTGDSVGDRLRRDGRFEWPEAVRFVREALRSLAEAHAKGIIHRDLKPDNLFLAISPDSVDSPREICKILDFGIAKWHRQEPGKIDQLETQAGTVFGTPRYMSPEQAQGSQLDARSDLYSLGVVLYQMLTGRAPFIDDDAVVVMARHIKDDPPLFAEAVPLVSVPAPIEAVVRRALAKSPDLRPATAEQMGLELARAEEQARALESGARSIPGVALNRTRVKLRRATLAGLLVGILGGVFLGWYAPNSPEGPTAVEQVSAPRVPVALTPRTLEPLEKEKPVTKEDSSADAPEPASSALPVPRVKRPRSQPSSTLTRKGNERYGRFE